MLSCLIYLSLFFSPISFSQTEEEIVQFANSPTWQKLLYYDDGQSHVESDRFFISSKGKTDPLAELRSNIEAFKNNQIGPDKLLYQCIFQARFDRISKQWPGLLPTADCKDFKDWSKNLDAGDLYLMYSSAYPNNPASMFGHTFLRFDRKTKGSSKDTKALLGYSLAFQARANPNDNSLVYTFKGIFGGYPAFLDIKPYYMDVGVYNNMESRDLWSYKLDLTKEEKELFIKHAWEFSLTAYFDYYFFDKNCSTFLLMALEAIRPSITFHRKNDLFVVPQEALKEIVSKFNDPKIEYRPSIKKRILSHYGQLSPEQKNQFSNAISDSQELANIKDPHPLDTLVEYWKLKNYQEKTLLSNEDKLRMYKTFSHRSKIKEKSQFTHNFDHIIKFKKPHYAHDLSRFSIGAGTDAYLNYRYGFHNFFDSSLGLDDASYISFFDISYLVDTDLFELKLGDILSTQSFSWIFPGLSWRGSFNYLDWNERRVTYIQGLLGISLQNSSTTFFTLVGPQIRHEGRGVKVFPTLNLGSKYTINNSLGGAIDLQISEKLRDANIELKKYGRRYNFGLRYQYKARKGFYSLFLERYF